MQQKHPAQRILEAPFYHCATPSLIRPTIITDCPDSRNHSGRHPEDEQKPARLRRTGSLLHGYFFFAGKLEEQQQGDHSNGCQQG
ncbi:hypothetical protein D3C80_1491740 [compost metagenome]